MFDQPTLYDILGKVAGLPLFRLLGGDKNSFETDITTGIDTTEAVVRETTKHAGWGYKTLKVKVGTDPDADFARLQAVRDAIGYDVRVRIDANQGWTVPQSIYALRKMDRLRIQLVEQPVVASDIAGLKTVRDASPIRSFFGLPETEPLSVGSSSLAQASTRPVVSSTACA